jgi:hypothetical protein
MGVVLTVIRDVLHDTKRRPALRSVSPASRTEKDGRIDRFAG